MNIIDKIWLVVKMVAFNQPEYVLYISAITISVGILVIVYILYKQKKLKGERICYQK